MMIKKFILPGALLLAAVACGYDNHQPPHANYTAEAATITIAAMKELVGGGASLEMAGEDTIAGTVTASDEAGNFFRSFMVEDATGAVEVMAGMYDMHVLWPVGRQVSVALGGLTLACADNIWQLGYAALPSDWRAVEYIAHPALVDRHIARGSMAPPPVPRETTIDELDESMAGRLVVVRGVTLRGGGTATWATPAADSYLGYPLSKEVAAEDAEGRRIWVHTSGYADFAGAVVPAGRVSLTGILAPVDGRLRIRLRGLHDVEMSNIE